MARSSPPLHCLARPFAGIDWRPKQASVSKCKSTGSNAWAKWIWKPSSNILIFGIWKSALSIYIFRCDGGYLQLSTSGGYDSDELAICGQNERYSPPIVLFKDPLADENSAASATLLFRIDETTSRSQFLAHFAFPSSDHLETGVGLKGASKLEDEGKCLPYMLKRLAKIC